MEEVSRIKKQSNGIDMKKLVKFILLNIVLPVSIAIGIMVIVIGFIVENFIGV